MPDNLTNPGCKPCLIILEDLLNGVFSKEVCHLFTKGNHHRNISVILITQNLFHQARYCRDISLNAKYIVLLKKIRDKHQFTHLARQVYPENSAGLYEAYLDGTAKPHGYFVLDFSQLRRLFFFNEENSRYVSVGFYPANNYEDLAEFGCLRIARITLTEQHVKTLVEHLPALCEALYRGEHYACKYGPFRLQSSGTHRTGTMYRHKKCVSFKLVDLRYMMNIYISYRFNKPDISLRRIMSWLLPSQRWDRWSLLSHLVKPQV